MSGFVMLFAVATALTVPTIDRRTVLGVLTSAPVLPAIADDLDSIESTGVGADRNFVPRMRLEPQQLAPTGKLDVNAASVVEYKKMAGLYPRVAGKIASHGPYSDVKDVYKVLDNKEAALFRKYQTNFVALPPGRQFIERINQRQSL